jgi:hypothetical protein
MEITRPIASRCIQGPLIAGLLFLGACASSPPPPSQAPAPAPVVETPPAPPAESDTTSQAAATEAAAPAAEPECQAADDCKKLREPAAGLQWTCENAHCLEQAVAEPPKTEQTAQATDAEKPSKKTKAKGKKK